MENMNALTIASAAVSMVLSSWAGATDTPPTLQVPAKAPATAAAPAKVPGTVAAPTPAKVPGTVAAPTPPTLSYLQPAASAPAPAAKPATTTAASAKAPPIACSARCAAAKAPVKKPVAKPTPRLVKKSTAAPIVKAPDGFDFRFNGDMWTAMQVLAVKHGPLELSKQGAVFPVPVKLDLRGVTLIDALAVLGEQGGSAADVVYNPDSRTAMLAYRDKTALPAATLAPMAFITDEVSKAVTARPQPAAVPVSPVDEAKNWQQGGVARPIMGQDGLLMHPFGQSQPTLTCMPLRACDIQLQPGELINNVIFGDTVRWVSSPATTGSGAQATPHVIVKPTETNLETNLLITTNRRSYMLTLKSREGKYVSRIGYYYPQEMVQDWNGQAEAERRKSEEDANRKISDLPITSIDQLNLDSYTIKGDRSLPWYPVRVFDEGTHVWIQMPRSIKASEAPALVLIGNSGVPELVNYRVKDADQGGAKVTYYIVDKLFTKAALIIGVGNDQQKIEIVKASKSSWFNFNN